MIVEEENTASLMVTIRCLTYNHEPYIRQCLDGFVMQKTNFRFEAIVHDDASTDGTAIIIREYAEKYPDIIRPIYETENQYSKHDGSIRRIMDAHTHGKYVALCEGDDYWIDPYKLQKQVDFLESHPDYVMCSHKWDEYVENENKVDFAHPIEVGIDGKAYNLDDFIHGAWFFQPLTVMYKRNASEVCDLCKYGTTKDITLFYSLLKQGRGFCLSNIMAVYRIHSSGIWSGISIYDRKLQDLKTKKSICDVEQTVEAAIFLLSEFTKATGRILILKNIALFWDIYRIFGKHFGWVFAIRLMLNKILRNVDFSKSEFMSDRYVR